MSELTWREAEDAMLAGEEVECTRRGGPLESWNTMRIQDGVLQFLHAGKDWLRVSWDYADLSALRGRRVPKTPRVHELAGKWRAGRPTTWEGVWATAHNTAETCASELEAALKADDLVSIKGLTAKELRDAYNSADGNAVDCMNAVLAHLRKRGTP